MQMKSKVAAALFCSGLSLTGIALAGPADYVYTPIVEYGEKEIDFKHGSARQNDGTFKQVTSLGLGYGATEAWFTEVYLKYEKTAGNSLTLAEWENKFQLTETGRYAVDAGFIAEVEAPLNNGNEPYEFKFGPLFQTEYSKLQFNGNLLFKRKFGNRNDGDDSYVTEFGYQWQAKYRWLPAFEYGLQGFGEMGEWNDWNSSSAQNHRLGPALFGKAHLGEHQAVKYNAAWLFGASPAAPAHTVRVQAEYEF
ncbi:MAG: hypothetical protein AUJ80_04755 [Gallionellaceae bacterium CG1_02_60_325]|nr:MAG: hypothetical protein AUJ80_04755 [Gallionellaceae bacterium CG1_02_60_325]